MPGAADQLVLRQLILQSFRSRSEGATPNPRFHCDERLHSNRLHFDPGSIEPLRARSFSLSDWTGEEHKARCRLLSEDERLKIKDVRPVGVVRQIPTISGKIVGILQLLVPKCCISAPGRQGESQTCG
jgi:hypothetical protein